MNKESKRLNSKEALFVVFFAVITIWMVRYSSSKLYNYFALTEFVWALFLLITEANQKLSIKYVSVLARLVFFIGVSICLIAILSSDKQLDMKYLGVLCVYLSPIVFGEWMQRKAGINLKRAILITVYWIWGYYGIKQLIFYSMHIRAARYLAANPLYYGEIAIGGGYFFAYGSVLLVVYLLERICFIKKSLGTMILCSICFIHVLMTESTLATIVMLLGISVVILKLIARKMHLNLFSIIFLGICSFGLFIISGTYKTLLTELYTHFSSIARPYAWRIIEIINLLLGNGVVKEGAIQSRWIVYKESIETILERPFWGSMLNSIYFDGGGGHSEVLDALARWGLVIGGLYLSIYIIFIRNIYKGLDCKVYIFSFICLIFLNPVAVFHFSFVMFLVIPLQQIIDKETAVCT